jgi:hypothetical protein
MAQVPPRDATDAYFRLMEPHGRRLDIAFDVDLGELVEGHRVIARGLELKTASGAVLHYEFVPGVERDERPFGWYWLLSASDDRGTTYGDENGGAFDHRDGRAAAHGERDLGGVIPKRATRLMLAFEPPSGWTPPEPWTRQIVINLGAREVVT